MLSVGEAAPKRGDERTNERERPKGRTQLSDVLLPGVRALNFCNKVSGPDRVESEVVGERSG